MSQCYSCGTRLKRGSSHCSQCGIQVKKTSPTRWTLYTAVALFILLIGGGFWLYSKWNEPMSVKNTSPEKDVQHSFTASTAPETLEQPDTIEEPETLPETEIVTGTFYESISEQRVEQFMYDFVEAFTRATYNENTDEVELYLAPGSSFETNTLDYLRNTLFERGIVEDQLETSLLSLKVDGVDKAEINDGEVAHVKTKETYLIMLEDSQVTASFETTYAVSYKNGKLTIEKNLESSETAREVETY